MSQARVQSRSPSQAAPSAAGVRLAGAGFVLRAWCAQDLEALLRHADDAAVAHGLSERFPHPYARDDGRRFLAGEVVDLRGPVFAIEIGGEACGGIAARIGNGERSHVADVGYWLGRAHWGCGTMTRALDLYLRWLVPAARLQRVQASVLAGNAASAAVLRKNGFRQEGLQRAAVRKPDGLHDLHLYGRLYDLGDGAPG